LIFIKKYCIIYIENKSKKKVGTNKMSMSNSCFGKYLAYFEVSCYADANDLVKEGGFIYAYSYADAVAQIEDAYDGDLESVTIELMDAFEAILPIEKARQVKDLIYGISK
jgi:hypothetical protein